METDLVNRDPNDLNTYIMVQFEDAIAEPEGAHSINCVWDTSFRCFSCWRDVWYKTFSFCFGVCLAAQWGFEFAWIAVVHVWCVTPWLKATEMNCVIFKRLYGLCVHCCCDPICEASALILNAFRDKQKL
ncbi:hypothetical protein SNE40_015813 [Patella caerulea]|uniref:Caveolin n=1 Tax=Patella caerulea TaxID=87958 RepID=A0AAN8PJW0_PATCE